MGFFASMTNEFESDSFAIIIEEAQQMELIDGQYKPTNRILLEGSRIYVKGEVAPDLYLVNDELGGESTIHSLNFREIR